MLPIHRFGSLPLLLVAAGALSAWPAGSGKGDLAARKQAALRRSESRAEAFEEEGHDRADLRKAWERFWFGGDPTPEYLRFKSELAAREFNRWPLTFPQGGRPMPFASAPTGLGGTWVNLGPTSNLVDATWPSIDSGRPVAIVLHPNYPATPTLYLATSGGGVFRSTNATPGSASDWTWTPITEGLPTSGGSGNVAIGYMAGDPSDANTLFIGLGDAYDASGRGFYKSTDGGNTWTPATGMDNSTVVYDILVLGTKVFAGTNDGLWISSNGGTSFTRATGGPSSGSIWTVKSLSATDLVCSNDSGAAYWSNDAGATWNAATGISGAARVTLSTTPASATQVWGMYEQTSNGKIARGVLSSIDKGHTYTFVTAPTVSGGLFQSADGGMSSDGGQGFYNHLLAVDPTNANHLFLGANLALWRSLDGGASWQQMSHWYGGGHPYSHADHHAWAFTTDGTKLFVANDGGLAVFVDPYRGTVPTDQTDLTFVDHSRNKGLATHLVYNLGSTLAATPADSRYRISLGLQDNGTRVRQDTGSGLQNSGTFEDEVGGDGFGTVIHQTDGNKMLGSLYYTRIYKSTNGGTSAFSSSSTGITESNNSSKAPFAPKIALGATSTPDTVYTFVNAKVYKSTDFGSNWTAMTMPAAFSSASPAVVRNVNGSRSNPNAVAVAATGGRFYVTYDGGATWSNASDATSGTYNTSYVWFNTENDQIVYGATVAPYSTAHHLFKSTDGGVNWTFIDQTTGGGDNGFPFGIPVHVIQNLPGNANTLFAGTDFGVYRSLDGGATWSRFGSGMPLVAVRDLYVAPDGSFVRAASFGRGVWELTTPTGPAVSLSPSAATVITGGTVSITPTVTNTTSDNTVNWTTTSGAVSPTHTATGVPTVFTAPGTAGTVTVTATTVETSAGVPGTANSTITVVNPTAVTVTMTPATSTSTTTNSTVNFTATVAGITDTGVNWTATGGTFNVTTGAAVTWTAPATGGTYTVTATAAGAPTRSASTTVTVVDPATITLSVSPTAKTLVAGGSQSFTATVSAGSVTWTLSPATGAGTITPSGLTCTYNAPATLAANQTVTLTATATLNNAKTAAATLSLKTYDLNGDAAIDVLDVLELTKRIGSVTAGDLAVADLNGDGAINDADLALLLGAL